MKAMALVLIAVATLAFAAGRVVTPRPVTSSRSYTLVAAASRDIADPEGAGAYGDEVINAVAEYSLDPAGDLFELHAPQFELPRFGSPKS